MTTKICKDRIRRREQKHAFNAALIDDSNDSDDSGETRAPTSTAAVDHLITFKFVETPVDEIDSDIDQNHTFISDTEDDQLNEDLSNSLLNTTPIFQSSQISVFESVTALFNFATTANLSKLTIDQLLRLLKSLLPIPNSLPTTHQGMMKVLGNASEVETKHYCVNCYQLCTETRSSVICDNRRCSNSFNGRPLKVSERCEVVTLDIRSQIKSIITRNKPYFSTDDILFPTFDIRRAEFYQKRTDNRNQRITLVMHADGAPLVRSTRMALWPLFASIVELPPPIREYQENIIVLALWASIEKPNIEIFLDSTIKKMKTLINDGFSLFIDGTETCIRLSTQFFVSDLPAKSLFFGIVNFNGYYACPVCRTKGRWKRTQVLYPFEENVSVKWNHGDFEASARRAQAKGTSVDGVKSRSPMLDLFKYPDQVIFDYMHLICLGHMRTLLKRWMSKITPANRDDIDILLRRIRTPHNMHISFVDSIQNNSHWKAKHFRLFVLHVGLPTIIPYVSKLYASHFALYSCLVTMLHSPISVNEIDFAENMVRYYCQTAPLVHGDTIEILSLHAHLHLPEQVRFHGGLAFCSAFSFESMIRHMKKKAHGSRALASQIGFWHNIESTTKSQRNLFSSFSTKNEISIDDQIIDPYRHTLPTNGRLRIFLRFHRSFTTFHSYLYDRSFNLSSHVISYLDVNCSLVFGAIVLFYSIDSSLYCLVQAYENCVQQITDLLELPGEFIASVNHLFPLRRISSNYVSVPIRNIQHKCISIHFGEAICLSEIRVDFEHD